MTAHNRYSLTFTPRVPRCTSCDHPRFGADARSPDGLCGFCRMHGPEPRDDDGDPRLAAPDARCPCGDVAVAFDGALPACDACLRVPQTGTTMAVAS